MILREREKRKLIIIRINVLQGWFWTLVDFLSIQRIFEIKERRKKNIETMISIHLQEIILPTSSAFSMYTHSTTHHHSHLGKCMKKDEHECMAYCLFEGEERVFFTLTIKECALFSLSFLFVYNFIEHNSHKSRIVVSIRTDICLSSAAS